MTGKECPNCKRGIMIRHGNRKRSKPQKRCTLCGYIESDTFNKSIGVIYSPGFQEDYAFSKTRGKVRKASPERIVVPPEILTQIRQERYIEKSIEKFLKKLRQNKYSTLIGEKIHIRKKDGKVEEYTI